MTTFAGPTAGLYDRRGHRKYLNSEERAAFLKASEKASREVRTLCYLLAYAGCRISEALALTADRIDLNEEAVIFETLKKRRAGIYRAVPIPGDVLNVMDLVHGIRDAQAGRDGGRAHRLWPWSRMTAWRRVREVMTAANIRGPHATPKGLRHGFGIAAVGAGIPLNLVQRWLGHAQLSTTAIYADATGAEEHDIARRMWV